MARLFGLRVAVVALVAMTTPVLANATTDTYDKLAYLTFSAPVQVPGVTLHAGTYGPNELDNTFGPEVKFIKAPGPGNQNLPPSAGMQFFGHVRIDGASGQMTVTLRDRADAALWSTTLDPKPV